MAQMHQIVFNDYVDAAMAGLFLFVVVAVAFFGLRTILKARAADRPSSQESPFETLPATAMSGS
jgi:carbon starvation protein